MLSGLKPMRSLPDSVASEKEVAASMMFGPVESMWKEVVKVAESMKGVLGWAFPKSPAGGAPSGTRPVEWPISWAPVQER